MEHDFNCGWNSITIPPTLERKWILAVISAGFFFSCFRQTIDNLIFCVLILLLFTDCSR